MTSRRAFLEQSALSALGMSLPLQGRAAPEPDTPATKGFLDLHRPPDAVLAETTSGTQSLFKAPANRWTADSITVTTEPTPSAVQISLSAPSTPVRRLHLRWRGTIPGDPLILGDAWERGYGDLEWRGWVPDRVMPWYFVTHDGALTHGYGVRTGPGALCFWQVDPHGISLWTDVRSGSVGVELGERTLQVCENNLPARSPRRIGRRGARPLPADVPRASTPGPPGLRQQRLVLGLRQQQRGHGPCGRAPRGRALATGQQPAVRGD